MKTFFHKVHNDINKVKEIVNNMDEENRKNISLAFNYPDKDLVQTILSTSYPDYINKLVKEIKEDDYYNSIIVNLYNNNEENIEIVYHYFNDFFKKELEDLELV